MRVPSIQYPLSRCSTYCFVGVGANVIGLRTDHYTDIKRSLNHRTALESRKANAVMPKVLVIQVAIAGDRYASTQIIMLPIPDD